jgi:hypothetical protein
MTDDEGAFVEAVGQFLGSSGMTPMSGRMWAWLLICDPPEQSATDLAQELKASRGSISGTARLLATAGLIRRTTRRGDRREYFSAPPGSFTALIETSGSGYARFSQLTEQGLALMSASPPASRVRLLEVHDAFAFLAREFPTLLERFRQQRGGTIAGRSTGASTRRGSR